MAYETGTASDYKDLLRRIRRFMLGCATPGTPGYAGTGNGTMTGVDAYPAAVTETWTIACTAAALNGGTFSVTGSVSGAQASATVGTPYDNGLIKFTINDGTTDFIVGDTFTIAVTVGAMPAIERWVDQRWVDAGGGLEWIFKAPGLAGADEIYGGVRSYADSGLDYYNFAMMGCTGFLTGNTFQTQPGFSPERHMMLWNQPIVYWLVGNGRRFALVFKISTYYGSMYLGHLMPYATPQQYPYPLAVGGMSATSALRYSVTDATNKSPFDPGGVGTVGGSLLVYHVDGSWQPYQNWNNSGGGDAFMAGGANQLYPLAWNWVRECVDASYALIPLIFVMNTPTINLIGEMDGAFWISGFSNASENTVTIGGDTYLVFQDGFRTGSFNYRALKLA